MFAVVYCATSQPRLLVLVSDVSLLPAIDPLLFIAVFYSSFLFIPLFRVRPEQPLSSLVDIPNPRVYV